MHGKNLIVWGAALTAFAIVLGAFGAHGFEGWVEDNFDDPAERTERLENWETSSRYFLYHAIGLILIGLADKRLSPGLAKLAAGLMALGIVLFSGCLYGWATTGNKLLVMIVPLGGLSFIAGWISFALAAKSGPKKESGGAKNE